MSLTKDVEAKKLEVDPTLDIAQGVFVNEGTVDRKYGHTQNGLSPRHVQLMAIGGFIGVGLLVGIGTALSKAGPLSFFQGYLTWCLFYVWPLNLCVPDMMAYLRVTGSIFELATRYVDPALGFAMSWTYFYAGVMLICVEYAAIATIMTFWEPGVNPAAWIVTVIAVCFILNTVAVKYENP